MFIVDAGDASAPTLSNTLRSRRPDGRGARWHTVFGLDWGELDILPGRPDWQLDRIGHHALGDLRYNHFALAGLHIRRTHRNLRRADAPSYVLALPQAGASRTRIDGEPVTVEPGRIYLLHGTISAEIHPQGTYETLNLQIPARLLQQRLSTVPKVFSASLDGGDPRAELLSHYVRHTYDAAPRLTGGEAGLLAGQLCDLVALMLRGDERACCDDRSLAAAHKRRVLDFIESHYGSEELSAELIARRCGISERYLHKLFQGTEQPVMERLKELRLERAHAMLANPSLANLPVSEIAYRNGFRSLSNFCRAFRRRYGCAPTALRQGG